VQFDYDDNMMSSTAAETDIQQLFNYKRISRHLSDTSFEFVSECHVF